MVWGALPWRHLHIIIFHYQIATARENKRSICGTLKTALPDMQRFRSIVENIKEKSKERKSLTAEKNDLSPIRIGKIRKLTQRITTITEEISELQSQKAFLLSKYSCVDDADMASVQKQAKDMEASLQQLEKQEAQFKQELDKELAKYEGLKEQASSLDVAALSAAKEALRPGKDAATKEKLQAVYGGGFDSTRLQRARMDTAAMLHEKMPSQQRQSIREQLEQNRQQQDIRNRKRINRSRDQWER